MHVKTPVKLLANFSWRMNGYLHYFCVFFRVLMCYYKFESNGFIFFTIIYVSLENPCEKCRCFSLGFFFFFFLVSCFVYIFILQIEPILSGNLPPGFDSSTCRSVWVLNRHFLIFIFFSFFFIFNRMILN